MKKKIDGHMMGAEIFEGGWGKELGELMKAHPASGPCGVQDWQTLLLQVLGRVRVRCSQQVERWRLRMLTVCSKVPEREEPRALQEGVPGPTPLPYSSPCGALGDGLRLSEPQSRHLQNRDHGNGT